MLYDDDDLGPATPAHPLGEIIDGRYRLDAFVDAGRFGQVYRAWDLRRRRVVAVKRLLGPVDPVAFRREVVALRALRIVGVVQLRDQGRWGGLPYLVTSHVDGEPFPGAFCSAPWPTLAPLAGQLLRTLARVHAAAAIHLDLKPANVLVTGRGAVHVLDLGLATGPALGAVAHTQPAGTAYWAAPEVLRGEVDRIGPPADVYSAGRLLADAVEAPPARVRAQLAAMLDPSPERRPSAWAVASALGLVTSPRLPPGDPVRKAVARAALQPGTPPPEIDEGGPVARERLLARVFGLRAAVPRAHVERALNHQQRIGALVADGRGRWIFGAPPVEPGGGRQQPEQARQQGRNLEAFRQVRGHLAAGGDDPTLLRTGCLAALAQRDPLLLDEAKLWLERAMSPQVELERLVDAALHRGEPERARGLLSGTPPTGDAEVLALHAALRLEVATDAERPRLVRAFEARAARDDHPVLRSALNLMRGRDAWRAGAYREAAALYQLAGRDTPDVGGSLRARMNATSALIEAGGYPAALRLARRCVALARALEHDPFATRSRWQHRAAARRSGCVVPVDEGFVGEAARAGDAHLTGLVALDEAIAAWRAGATAVSARLAAQATAALRLANQAEAAVALAEAIHAVSAATPMGLEIQAERARSAGWPDIDWQVLGVLASVPAGGSLRGAALTAAALAPDPDRRREVFAPAEVLAGFVAPNWRGRI